MKILDRYILTSYLKTFISVFVILMLIFVLQAIWLYIKELAGKDLDILTVMKFLLYITPTLIPLILPLTILLASIMVFGNFAENYEFAAMKSTGISLQRAMSGLSIFILLLSITTFFFSNNVIPWAEYESFNLRKNIAKVKPAMAIAKGQFNQLGENFNIKVENKTGERGQYLENVIIHQGQVKRPGNHKTIIAERGELVNAENSDILKLILFDGYYYDDTPPNSYNDRKKKPFVKSTFKEYTMNIDLSQLNAVDLDDKSTDSKYTMLSVAELDYTTDSLITQQRVGYEKFGTSLYGRTNIATLNLTVNNKKDTVYNGNLMDLFQPKRQVQILDYAINSVSSTKQIIVAKKNNIKRDTIWLNKHIIAQHEKFALAIACIILFFVGAPLGALIRKGGLGLPMVIAIVLFLAYHFIGIFAKNSAKDGTFNPALATWFSTLIMLPLGIYLTNRATKDRGLFEASNILDPLKRLFRIKRKDHIENTNVFKSDLEEYKTLESYNDNKLIGVIKNFRSYNYEPIHKNTAIEILNNRGISLQQLKFAGHISNTNSDESIRLKNEFEEASELSMILYIISVISILLGNILANNKLPSIGLAIAVFGYLIHILFYVSLSESFKKHSDLYKHLGKDTTGNAALFLLIGTPLYFINYFFQKSKINKDLKVSKISSAKTRNETLDETITKETSAQETTNNIEAEASVNQKTGKSLIKAAVTTLVFSLILLVLHFVFANNKLPLLADTAIQLSPILLIVSIFFFIKRKFIK